MAEVRRLLLVDAAAREPAALAAHLLRARVYRAIVHRPVPGLIAALEAADLEVLTVAAIEPPALVAALGPGGTALVADAGAVEVRALASACADADVVLRGA